jgi:hypothetical protein
MEGNRVSAGTCALLVVTSSAAVSAAYFSYLGTSRVRNRDIR